MNFENVISSIKKSAEALGIKEYEIYYTMSEDSSVETLKDEVSTLTSNTRGGLCFRCRVNGKMGYASTELMSESEMHELVERAVQNAENTEKEDNVGIFEGSESYGSTNSPEYMPLSPNEMKAIALTIQKENYAASESVTDGTQSAVITQKNIIRIVNSNGIDLMNVSGGNIAYSVAVISKDGEYKDDFAMTEIGRLSEKELAEKAVKGALDKLGSESVETGKYNVVISGKQMRTILSVFADAFSAKTAQAGMSQLSGKEGEKIAAEIINITDDPMREGVTVQIPFDAEGVAAYKKTVVDGGVLKTLLHNRETALKAGVKTTGNASKGAYYSPIGVSPYAFCIEAGKNTLQELFDRADNGIYVTEVKGLHAGANAVTGEFSIESAGYMIENGKRSRPVRSFTISGNFFELLKVIDAISDELDIGITGGVTVFGSPDVLIKGMSIAGK